MSTFRAQGDENRPVRVAQAHELSGIDSVEVGERQIPLPAAGQVRVRVHGAGVGPWDVVFVDGSFPGISVPFVPGQEVAGVVDAVGGHADLKPGDKVFASLFPEGGGFAELALASVDRLAPMPEGVGFEDAASLVVAGGTAHEGLVDRGRLQAGETVLITAAAGVGSAAVQIARGLGARPLGVAGPHNHEYVRGLGAGDVFDYHAADWVAQVRAVSPGGVDLLFDAAGGGAHAPGDRRSSRPRPGDQRDPPVRSSPARARDHRRVFCGAGQPGAAGGAAPTSVEAGTLRPQVEAALPLEQAREALRRVAGRHTRGKIALRIAADRR